MVAPPYVAALVGSEPQRRAGYRIGRNNDQRPKSFGAEVKMPATDIPDVGRFAVL